MIGTMVQKTNQSKGYLFDDTPRGILEALLVVGVGAAALTVAPTLLVALGGIGFAIKAGDKVRYKKLRSSLQYLRRKGYIEIGKQKGSARFRLTKNGENHIRTYLNRRAALTPPERPKAWDKKWRIILFDIPAGQRSKRNAFRSLIRRLGAIMLQKSVWIYPFDCSEQVNLMKKVFSFSSEELRLVVADSIGEDVTFRKHFSI